MWQWLVILSLICCFFFLLYGNGDLFFCIHTSLSCIGNVFWRIFCVFFFYFFFVTDNVNLLSTFFSAERLEQHLTNVWRHFLYSFSVFVNINSLSVNVCRLRDCCATVAQLLRDTRVVRAFFFRLNEYAWNWFDV